MLSKVCIVCVGGTHPSLHKIIYLGEVWKMLKFLFMLTTQFWEYVLSCTEYVIQNLLINTCICIGGAYFIDRYVPSKKFRGHRSIFQRNPCQQDWIAFPKAKWNIFPCQTGTLWQLGTETVGVIGMGDGRYFSKRQNMSYRILIFKTGGSFLVVQNNAASLSVPPLSPALCLFFFYIWAVKNNFS